MKLIKLLIDLWESAREGEQAYNEKMFELYGGNNER